MQLGVTKKRAVAYLSVSLLCLGSFNGLRPDSTLEKCALGALAAVGVGAVGCLAWNSDYYSAERFLDGADREEQDARDYYERMLRLAATAHERELLDAIEQMHRRASDRYDLRAQYPLLWYVDQLSGRVNRLRELHERLAAYAHDMQRYSSYYRKLRAQRDAVAERVVRLLPRVRALLDLLLALPQYHQQDQAYKVEKARREREERLERERQKIRTFERTLTEVRRTFQGISSDFSREYSQLMAITVLGDFELCLQAIISSKYVTFDCYTTQRSAYAALWYEERVMQAIRSLEHAYKDLYEQHRTVCRYEQYPSYGLEYEYNQLMQSLNDHLIRLRDIRDRLPRTCFYIADLQAYEYACRQREVACRERNVRQREYAVNYKESEVRHAERAARQREQAAHDAVRDAEREAKRARREARELEREKDEMRKQQERERIERERQQREKERVERERIERERQELERQRQEQERLRLQREQEVLRERQQQAQEAQERLRAQELADLQAARRERDISVIGGWQ